MAFDVAIQKVAAAQTRPLRRQVLRPHQEPEECVYPLDDVASTGHFVALVAGQIVGVASIFEQSRDGDGDGGAGDVASAWRIRGMATTEEVRGRGCGGLMLEACLDHARDYGGRTVWCNGRTNVAGFYRRYGFAVVGDEFDLPGLGPHLLLERQLQKPL